MLLMEWKMAAPLICRLRPPGPGHIIQTKSLKAGSCLIWKETWWGVRGQNDVIEV